MKHIPIRGAVSVVGAAAVLALNATAVAAEPPGQAARDVLIDKLSKVVLQLPDADPSKVGITLRLADLLSERARAAQRADLESGCSVCDAGRDDREKALRHYQNALPYLNADQAGRVLTQIGHLYQMNGEEVKAIATYERIIATPNTSPEIASEADFSLAEVYFKRRQYDRAKSHYQKVLDAKGRSAKGFAAYRMAWSDFYLGHFAAASAIAERILNSPQLLTRTATVEVAQVDTQFQEEVARDYVTFLAQQKVTQAEAEKVYNLSPEKARLAHLFFLATELERLGQKESSIGVYRFLQQKEDRPIFKLEGQVRLAQLEMELKQIESALNDYERGLQLWPEVCEVKNAPSDHCKELRVRLKNFVIDWHKIEKEKPSAELYSAYKLYLARFAVPEMAFQAGLIAKNHKNFVEAAKLFQTAGTGFKAQPNADEPLEAALLSYIEVMELAGDKEGLATALQNYLQESRTRSKALEAEYQLARIEYDKGDNEKAAVAFRQVVTSSSKGAEDLRIKAADLALDALAQLKRDADIQMRAREFAAILPVKASEYHQIAAKAGLNIAANMANVSAAEALKALKQIDIKNLTDSDRIQYLKNRLLIAEKSQNWVEARLAADDLLAEKGLSIEDKDFALEHKAYLAELILDFKTAYATVKQFSKKASALRLAMLAELAREDATEFYRARLSESTDASERRAIATKIIRESKTPDKEWQTQRAVFADDLNAYAQLALEIFARSDEKMSARMRSLLLKDKSLAQTPAYKALARESLFDEYEKLASELSAHRIVSDNERKMVASIKQRGTLLIKTEKLAQNALEMGDFTSQAIALDLLAKESARFYMDLIGLPVPQGLTPEEERQYMALLSEQAAPHRIKSEEISAKVAEFWAQKEVFAEIQKSYENATPGIQRILARELSLLSKVAPLEVQENFKNVLAQSAVKNETQPVTEVAQIERARDELRRDPLNVSKIEGLLQIERQLGPSPMVSYLEQRLESLKKSGGSL